MSTWYRGLGFTVKCIYRILEVGVGIAQTLQMVNTLVIVHVSWVQVFVLAVIVLATVSFGNSNAA